MKSNKNMNRSKMFSEAVKRMELMNVNSYDWRKKVYNSSGFETEDSIGFWYKKIKK